MRALNSATEPVSVTVSDISVNTPSTTSDARAEGNERAASSIPLSSESVFDFDKQTQHQSHAKLKSPSTGPKPTTWRHQSASAPVNGVVSPSSLLPRIISSSLMRTHCFLPSPSCLSCLDLPYMYAFRLLHPLEEVSTGCLESI